MKTALFRQILITCDRLGIWVFGLSIFNSLISLISYSFAGELLPSFFGIPKISPGFADLRQLTSSSACESSFNALLTNQINCDPWLRPFNYTELSLALFRMLNVDKADTPMVGFLIGIIAITASLAFIFLSTRSLNAAYWLSALFITSFPFQLAIERGNYDLIILVISLLAPVLLFTRLSILIPVLAFCATALKLFPAVGFSCWSIGLIKQSPGHIFKPNRARSIAFLTLIGSLLGLVIQTGDFRMIFANTPRPDGDTSFGLLTTCQSTLGDAAAADFCVLKIFIFAVSARWFFLRLKHTNNFTLNIGALPCQSALLFGTLFTIVYLVSRSWDYRLVFCIGFLPAIGNVCHSPINCQQKHLLLFGAGWIFVFYEQYLGGSVGAVLHVLSDMIIQPAILGMLVVFLIIISRTVARGV